MLILTQSNTIEGKTPIIRVTTDENDQFGINVHKPFVSIANTSKKLIAKVETPFALDVSSLPAQLIYVFLTYLSKVIYTFEKYKKSKSNKVYHVIDNYKKGHTDVKHILQVIDSANLTRNIQNEPANMMSPFAFCNEVKALLPQTQIEILGVNEMKHEGLNLVLAVGMSSKRAPKFLVIKHFKSKQAPTIGLIGKTVVYDAGGLNIKLQGMTNEMKTDKSGGAVVAGILKYFSENSNSCNIVAICPVVENLLGNDVTRPGDIVKSHNGKTVEITDSDAEGRLIVADAISYLTSKFNPKYIINFATLTGWADSVHSDINAVCYCRDIKLASVVNDIGEQVGERVWFLPHWDEYMEDYTQSKVANVRNYSYDKKEGAYLPVMFIMNFVPDKLKDRFIHFDITNNWRQQLALGNCVALGIELVKRLSKK